MAYSEKLANRIRERLAALPNIEEKQMMGGRIDPDLHETAISKTGCRTMDFTNRPMSGYVLIDESGMKTQKDFEYWISLALDFNKKAKASRKRK